MFETSGVIMDKAKRKIFKQGDDIKLTMTNGSVILCYIEEIDVEYDKIQIGADFFEENIYIYCSDIENIEKDG